VLRAQSSVHVDLPRAGVVARVEAPGYEDLAEAQVWAARLLAERGAPAARLFRPETRQPVVVENVAITLWHRLRPEDEPSYRGLGETLRLFHAATRDDPPSEVRALDPFKRARGDLAWPSPYSGSETSAELSRRLEVLALEWPAAAREDPLGSVVVHGDVHIENLMRKDDERVLIDLEDAGVGPASWDLAPISVQANRYGLPPARREEFLAGYGAEPGGWPGFDLMCQVYEIQSVCWAMRCSVESPRMAAEATIRVDGLLHGGDRPWTLL